MQEHPNIELAKIMASDSDGSAHQAMEHVDQKGLATVAELARKIRDHEETIEALEEVLKTSKKALRTLTDEDLPAMLAELGINSFSLEDGSTVEVKQTYGASILVDKRPEAYEWLRAHGYDDIITQGYLPEQKTAVHPQTLRAFVKERCEEGDAFPMELFGAWIGQRAVIKTGKK